jgi:LacI family transcriptional regulator
MEYRVDALVCVTYLRSPTEGISWATEAQQSRLPCVVLDCLPDDNASLDGVASDDKAGAHAAVTHLIRLGHRRIGHLVGDQRVNTGADRYDGYGGRCRMRGWRSTSGSSPAEITGARMAVKDAAASRAGSAADGRFRRQRRYCRGRARGVRARGLDAPRDIALVGYGNLEASRGFGLTTVDQNPRRWGGARCSACSRA